MKNFLLVLLTVILVAIAFNSKAQTLPASYMYKYDIKNNKPIHTKSFMTVSMTTTPADSAYYSPHIISEFTPSVSIQFNQVEKGSNGNYEISTNQFVPQFSYDYLYGLGTRQLNGGTKTTPFFSVGVIGGVGIRFDSQGNITPSVQAGGQVVIWTIFAAAVEYDFAAKQPVIGFTLNVPFQIFDSGAGTVILNKF